LHGGRHGRVQPRHFYLVIEVGRAAQPADQERRALALGRGHDQIAKGDAGEITTAGARKRAAGLLDHGAALLGREQGCLAGMGADREYEPVREPDSLAHEVEMAVGDGIERPGKERGPRHAGGLARALGSRKVVQTTIRTGGGTRRTGAIRGGTNPGRMVCQWPLSLRFLRLLLNQNYELLPSCTALALPAPSWAPRCGHRVPLLLLPGCPAPLIIPA